MCLPSPQSNNQFSNLPRFEQSDRPIPDSTLNRKQIQQRFRDKLYCDPVPKNVITAGLLIYNRSMKDYKQTTLQFLYTKSLSVWKSRCTDSRLMTAVRTIPPE